MALKMSVVGALFILACATVSSRLAPDQPRDIPVLAAALHSALPHHPGPPLVVIHDTTSFDDHEFSPTNYPGLSAFVTKLAPMIPSELLSALPAANTEPLILTRRLPLPAQHVFVSSVSIDSLVRASGGDEGTFGNRPYALVLVSLSRPAFSADGEHALVMVDLLCGGRCGAQELVALKKDAANWIAVARVPIRLR